MIKIPKVRQRRWAFQVEGTRRTKTEKPPQKRTHTHTHTHTHTPLFLFLESCYSIWTYLLGNEDKVFKWWSDTIQVSFKVTLAGT